MDDGTPPPAPTDLYRMYDADGQLLYVGVSGRFPLRLHEHTKTKSWWPQVVEIRIESHPSRDEAFAAEAKAIDEEGPLHNIRKGRRECRPARVHRVVVKAAPTAPVTRDVDLSWLLHSPEVIVCGKDGHAIGKMPWPWEGAEEG